ncbi:MAG TPA: FtsX-like permease family protein, partial [Thermoplasmata archaeon]|nr:FtsX-like permease family protein [Thermoplasmata archaeon]
ALLVSLLAIASGFAIAVTQSSANLHRSIDRTYEELSLCDLSVHTVPVSADSVREVSAVEGVRCAEGRLLRESRLVDTGAMGLLIGIDHRRHPLINDVRVVRGSFLSSGGLEALVEEHYADSHGIGPGDTIVTMTGGMTLTLRVVGVVLSPEYLYVMGDPAHLFPDESSFGAIFVPLTLLQNALDLEGRVNNILILADEPGEVYDRIVHDGEPPDVAGNIVRVDRRGDIWSVWALENDIHGFDELNALVTTLVLIIGGSAMGITMARIVASHGREIGILMAMGAPAGGIVTYYLLTALVIGLMGVAVGAFLGLALSWWIVQYYSSALNVPVIAFRPDAAVYAQNILYAMAVIMAASAVPAVRAARSRPHEAIRLVTADSPGISGRALRSAPLVPKIALRNLCRRKWRSSVTSFGIGLSLVIPFSIAAIFTSIDHTIEVGFEEEHWDQLVPFTHLVNTSEAEGLSGVEGIGRVEPILVTYGLVGERYYTFRGIDQENTLSRLNIVEGTRFTGPDTMIVDEKVAREQGLHVGDTVVIPFPLGPLTVRVVGVNSVILQGVCYLPRETLQNHTYPGKVSAALVTGDATGGEDLPFV